MQRIKHGFTLIELMIVVAIIAIIAAIAIPNFLRFQLRARSSEAKTNIATIRDAMERYYADHSVYPDLATSPAINPVSIKATWIENPFSVIDWTPPNNETYFQYAVVTGSSGKSFTIGARADLDSDGVFQFWGYTKPVPGDQVAPPFPFEGSECEEEGTVVEWNSQHPSNDKNPLRSHLFVGPCDVMSGRTEF